ncbi:UDP-glucose dehydrogenase family protein [Staphylospora marina]|uniref:UDP-glucose dehydrogenase family protein n=1 Tax=Staphylospora marina TaxID=2490858 RepID=UPI000F5BC6FA|nr:UDP-glucose/GDP-mannose dehydrogenase family protein [Staphylospora marina]
MNVTCIGSGYVGSVTAAAFAALGHHTCVVDVDPAKVESIRSGSSPIYEPGLEALIRRTVGKTLFADTSFASVSEADLVFICVGTPTAPDGTADLTYVKSAAESIGRHLSKDRFTVVVDKSTVPVGTADLVSRILAETSGLEPGNHFAVVSNPEFLREGFALEDVFFPDRIVIGAEHERAFGMMRELYRPLVKRERFGEFLGDMPFFEEGMNRPEAVWFETDTKSAEMIKYASNAFLAVKISYINEVARLCEALGANVQDVARGMGLDSRIGEKFLQVSSGWSGSCFPKDTAEFLATSRKADSELSIVRAAVESNRDMHRFVVRKAERKLGSLDGKTVGILGLTFKPDTDDARQTQAAFIIRELLAAGAGVRAHDPKGMSMFREVNPDLPVHYCDRPEDVAEGADAIILLTHWREYLELDWSAIGDAMRQRYVLDTRNFLPPNRIVELGFELEGIGVPPRKPAAACGTAVETGH